MSHLLYLFLILSLERKRGFVFDTKPYASKMHQALARFEDDLKKVRTGRAHPGMLDGIMVEVYGTRLPLNQAANITAAEAQMLIVTPFDPSNIQKIAAGIRNDQSAGFNPTDDGRVIRVPVPPLTEERRRQIVKQTSERVEETRITLRTIRQDALKDARRRKEAKEISEDVQKRAEKDMDKLMAEYQDKIEATFRSKEKEILSM